jgi:hypothetical protein
MSQQAVVDSKFLRLLVALQVEAANFSESVTANASTTSFQLEGLTNTVDFQDNESLNKELTAAFRLQEAETALISAYKPEDPGNFGDNLTLTTQLDYAAQLERAYRARNLQSFPRMLAHTTNRKSGHGAESGLFTGQVREYVMTLLNYGRDSEVSSGS